MKNIIFVTILCTTVFVLLCGALVTTVLQENISGIAAVATLMYGASTIAGWGLFAIIALVMWDFYKATGTRQGAEFRTSWAPVDPVSDARFAALSNKVDGLVSQQTVRRMTTGDDELADIAETLGIPEQELRDAECPQPTEEARPFPSATSSEKKD